MSRAEADLWSPFVRAAIGVALTGGFGLGAALFGAIALRLPLGLWWSAAAQAHGQLQLVGWAGLMVLGVGFLCWPFSPPVPKSWHSRTWIASNSLRIE